MADEDSSWMLDDDTFANDSAPTNEVVEDSQTVEESAPVEVPKPPAEWRKTYKHDVSTTVFYGITVDFARKFVHTC